MVNDEISHINEKFRYQKLKDYNKCIDGLLFTSAAPSISSNWCDLL